jgi:hypothetical protein
MSNYDYLKKYIIPRWTSQDGNTFSQVNIVEILDAEKRLNTQFPEELKQFWIEIGTGFFEATSPEIGMHQNEYPNRLLPPDEIALILTEGAESGLITEEVLEYIDEEELPFFEICDHSSFLYIRPNSDKPNAVYGLGGDIVEDSIETFIWKLYHVSPTYYLDKL